MLILLAVMVILMIPKKRKSKRNWPQSPKQLCRTPIHCSCNMPGLPNIELGENDELKEQIEKFAAAKPVSCSIAAELAD